MFSRRRSLFDFSRGRLAKGPRRVKRRGDQRGVRLGVELLEERRMLAVDPFGNPALLDFAQRDTSLAEQGGFGLVGGAVFTEWFAILDPDAQTNDLEAVEGVTSVTPFDTFTNTFLVQFDPDDVPDDIVDLLLAVTNVVYAFPDILEDATTTFIPNDPLFTDQWHLRNTGQTAGTVGVDARLELAWDVALGAGATIAIVDDGLQHTHPDLMPNYDATLSRDFAGSDSDPTPDTGDGHGTAAAGVAAARGNNSLGVTGAAPQATLAGIRLYNPGPDGTFSLPRSRVANALSFQSNLIDIYNNSWGPTAPSSFEWQNFAVNGTFLNGVQTGRNGLGSIFVFSAGNNGALMGDTNYSGLTSSRFTIAVGAIDHNGDQSSYSNPGASLLVVAPSSGASGARITTSDLADGDGDVTIDNPATPLVDEADYVTNINGFGGTSSSAPLVAGVIALVLDVNPNLTWRDVQAILLETAWQNDLSHPDWSTNGAGRLVNHAYGFGTVDANAAVQAAASWVNLAPEQTLSAPTVNVSQTISDNNSTGVVSTVNVSNVMTVESAEVRLNISHANRGDLEVNLISPDGTRSRLAETRNDTGDDYTNWVFTSKRHWGEISVGQWSLEVKDLAVGTSGIWNDWQLTLNGTAPPAPDSHESNDTLGTATFFGSLSAVTLNDLSIHNLADRDFFEIVANQTGRTVVHVNFPHAIGDLNVNIRDIAGNIIATSNSTDDDEDVVFPVVAQESYFVEAFGFNGAVNNYSLEIENFATPVPTGVHLDPASDTGSSNHDNVTADTTPTFFIQTDVLNFVDTDGNLLADDGDINVLTPAQATAGVTDGIAVEVTLINTTTNTVTRGFAEALPTIAPEVYRFTPAALADGVYFVSARTVIFDSREIDADPATAGTQRKTGRSNASEPLWITIDAVADPVAGTIELLLTSDSGMIQGDHVTKINQPAFGGVGPANAQVRVFAELIDPVTLLPGAAQLVGQGQVNSDSSDGAPGNGLGSWEVTVEPLIDGLYNIFAVFEDAAGNISGQVALSGGPMSVAANVAIPDDGTPVLSLLDLSGLDLGTIHSVDVRLNIQHPNVGDLEVTLISPTNTRIRLVDNRGGTGDNFTNTLFAYEATALISAVTAADAPFTGTFRAEEYLGLVCGQNPNGRWQLEIIDNTPGNTGTLVDWGLVLNEGLIIDTAEPNTPFLDLTTDTGRHDADEVTKTNLPTVVMRSNDTVGGGAVNPFPNDVKYRLYLRPDGNIGTSETLVYDSFTARGGFTTDASITQQISLTLNDPNGTPIPDGVHNLKLEIEDRAGNISHDFLLEITVDTAAPPVAFGQPGILTDGLHADSDTGVLADPATLADRITADSTPSFWGLAEADSIVQVFLDLDGDGVIDLNSDLLLGQTVATPFNGNLAFADGYWEITSAIDLNDPLLVLPTLTRDGLRSLLVTAQDVAGNPMPVADTITVVDEIDIFLDTQGPQVQDVFLTDFPAYDLFDPKPSENGFTPLVDRITVKFTDLPARLQEFLYPAINEGVAVDIGNYQLVGDHVGNILIREVLFNDLTQPGSGGGGGGGAAVGSGGVIIDGGDRDDHGSATAGPDAVLGTADDVNVDGWQFIEQMVAYAAANSQNTGAGLLVVGATAGSALDAITSVATVLGLPITVATTGGVNNLTTINFTDFAIIYVPSDSSNTNGGVSDADLDTLTARKLDVQNYVNTGGSLVALTEEDYATPYSWLELPDPFVVGDSATNTQYQTQALIDAGLVITNAELINGTPLHNTFTGPAGFNGLQPFVYNLGPNSIQEDGGGDDQIITLGLGQGGFIGGMVMTEVTLIFDQFLPDDRYTLTVSDAIPDDAGNALDGESQVGSPFNEATQQDIVFPSGNGVPGGDFVARFTVDSRPEIGSFVAQNIDLDINGNFVWDPANAQIGNDATNVDLTFRMNVVDPATGAIIAGGYGVHDLAFAGKFTNGAALTTRAIAIPERLFDQLAVFGWETDLLGQALGKRWLVDTNSDGVINTNDGDWFTVQPLLANFEIAGAVPIAGNFDGNAANGDEIGLYNAGQWALDTDRDFIIQPDEVLAQGNLLGYPIVGDFDGNGEDDLAVFNNNTWQFDMNVAGFDSFADDTIVWGFPGVLDRPVTADFDQDGIDDIGLWVPRNSAQSNRPIAEWYFLVSGDPSIAARNAAAGMANLVDHPFEPVPFGNDLYAEFGDELALPIVGNFDPPVVAEDPTTQNEAETGDFDQDGDVDGSDFLAMQRGFGMSGQPSMSDGDGNSDGVVDYYDMELWASAYQAGVAATSDFNGDGQVDGGDLSTWAANFGTVSTLGAAGDATGDGSVNGADFLRWQRSYQSSTTASVAASLATSTFATSTFATSTTALSTAVTSPPPALAAESAAPNVFELLDFSGITSESLAPAAKAAAFEELEEEEEEFVVEFLEDNQQLSASTSGAVPSELANDDDLAIDESSLQDSDAWERAFSEDDFVLSGLL